MPATPNSEPNLDRFPPETSSRREWALAATLSALFALAAFLPYAFALLTTPPDRFYMGFILNAKDQNTYFMWMVQVAGGDLFLRNLYTSLPHPGAMLNAFFWLAAQPARWFGWSLDTCYLVIRVLSSFVLGLATWHFCALFFRSLGERFRAWGFALFAAGLGWLTSLLALAAGKTGGELSPEAMMAKPLDTWVPEAYPWFSALVVAHFAMAVALLLLCLRWAGLGLLRDRLRSTLLAGVCLFALSFVHPYDVIVAYAVVFLAAGFLGLRRGFGFRLLRHPLLLGLLGAPPILYNYVILHGNAGMKAWLEQNISFSPPPLTYLLGFGVPLALAAVWLVRFFRDRSLWETPRLLLAAWIAAAPFMLYAPLAFQRRLAVGFSVPLALVALDVLRTWWAAAARRGLLPKLAVAGLVAASLLTSAFHLANSFRKVADRRGENYADAQAVALLSRLRTAGGDGCVLASFETGNLVPRFTGHATPLGSRGQSAGFDALCRETERFYGGEMGSEEQAGFLRRHRVRWVVVGPAEAGPGGADRVGPSLLALGWRVYGRTPSGAMTVYTNGALPPFPAPQSDRGQ